MRTAKDSKVALLQANVLRSASSGQLLGKLVDIYHVLEAASAPLHLEKSFVEELLRQDIVNSKNVDMQFVVSSIVVDVLRIASSTTASSLPFSSSHAKPVLVLLTTAIGNCRKSQKPSSAHLMHARHIAERLASTHSVKLLVSLAPESDDSVSDLFDKILDGVEGGDDDPAFLSRLAIILSDAISGTHSITEEQLGLLLNAVTSAKKSSNPGGAQIAAAVLKKHEEMLAPSVSAFVGHSFEAGVEELRRVDVADGDGNERRAALKQIAGALEVTVELTKVGINLVAQLVPQLQQHLTSDSPEVRLLTVRGFTKIFLVAIHVATSFAPAWGLLLSRFNDPKQQIRHEMVKFAQLCLTSFPTEANWRTLTIQLEAKLVDTDESVRRAAIGAVCELAAACSSSIPPTLVENVGNRCADKNIKVRQYACEKLCQLYTGVQFSWIPDSVFLSIRAEGGVVGVELGLEDMLPAPTKVADEAESQRKVKKAKEQELAVFDFELSDAHEVSDEALQLAAKKATFVDGLCKLCGDLNDDNWLMLSTLMGKKYNLRQTILRLYELRAEVKKCSSPETPEAQTIISGIRRLLAFLQDITHAKKQEWDSLFRAKDEKVSKAFVGACSDNVTDCLAAMNKLCSELKGRVPAEVLQFVEKSLVRRMFLPVSRAHVEELVARIVSERNHAPGKRVGAIRAASAIIAMSPNFLPLVFPTLVEALTLEVTKDDQQSPVQTSTKGTKKQQAESAAAARADQEKTRKLNSSLLLLLLKTLSQVGSLGVEAKTIASMIEKESRQLITTLGRLCIATTSSPVAKATATLLVSLFPNHLKAFSQLFATIREKVTAAVTDRTMVAQLCSWMKVIGVLAQKDSQLSTRIVDEDIVDDISLILAEAVAASGPQDGIDAKSKKVDLIGFESLPAEVVDSCCKALTRIALSQPATSIGILIPKVIDTLLGSFKATRELGSSTAGACKKRLAITQQLVKLITRSRASIGRGTIDTQREIVIAVVLSAEDNSEVRHAIQKKLQTHIAKQRCEMSVVAVLFLTAISEDTRAGYNVLRTCVHSVGDKLRSIQVNESLTLSDPKALTSWIEYTIPTLVLYLAHHSFFASESESNFTSFQRVWHLVFDELFRVSTNGASFCGEMVRKLKQMDDSLDPDSTATRVMCDLAWKVMIECLGQKQVKADTLKPYPGAVLIPKLFEKPRDPSRFPADVIYIDSSVTVGPAPTFKIVVGSGVTPGKSAGREGTASQPMRQDGNDNEEVDAEMPTPAADAKRAREEDDKDEVWGEESADEKCVTETVRSYVASLTKEQFYATKWNDVRVVIEKALGKKISPELKEFARMKMSEMQPSV